MAGSKQVDSRPLSPHLTNWKWHVTMLTSILHRASGIVLYIGTFLITAWIIALATSRDAYQMIEGIMFSIFGQLILFGFTVAVLFHFANGIRHLLWDGPRAGFEPGTANIMSWFNIAFAILGAAAVWSIAYFVGA